MNHPFPEKMATLVLPHSDVHLKKIEKRNIPQDQVAKAINNGATALELTASLADYQKSKSDSIKDALIKNPVYLSIK